MLPVALAGNPAAVGALGTGFERPICCGPGASSAQRIAELLLELPRPMERVVVAAGRRIGPAAHG